MCAVFEVIDFGITLLQEELGAVQAPDTGSTDYDNRFVLRDFGEMVGKVVEGDVDGTGDAPHDPFFIFTHINQGVISGVKFFSIHFNWNTPKMTLSLVFVVCHSKNSSFRRASQ